MGIVQDALLGVRFMTLRDVFIEKTDFMCAMMWISTWDGTLPAPAIIKPRPLWTGKQLFSMISPKINYRGKSKNHKDDPKIKDPFNYLDSEVLIHNGILLQGIVDKNIVGTSGGSIVHVTWLQKGWEETRNFMNQIQAVVNFWMANVSYSVSVSDTVADADTIHNIQSALNEAKEKVRNIMAKAQSGRLTMMPGKLLMESFEMNINEVLNDARSTVGKSAQFSLKERNAIKGTVMAGSKGSELNISQIIACVGQQNVQGKRIRYGFNQRTLPHFAKDDLGMESRGFVRPESAGVLLSRHGRPRGMYRYRRQDRRDRVYPAPHGQGDGDRHGAVRHDAAQCARLRDAVPVRRGRHGCAAHRETGLRQLRVLAEQVPRGVLPGPELGPDGPHALRGVQDQPTGLLHAPPRDRRMPQRP
jgi:DNA-directed RNA polymerase beta' subunit